MFSFVIMTLSTLIELYYLHLHSYHLFTKALREKQKSVRDNHAPRMKQMKLWKVPFMSSDFP